MKITEQDALDILTNAVETGIGYWARVMKINRNEESYVTAVTVEDNDTTEIFTVLAGEIQLGVDKVLSEDFEIADWVRNQILTKDFDAITDDVIFQALCFGEIVYS